MTYTIGEAAKKMGVAPSTLRYYEKEGLLPFVERSQGGIRVFRDSDFEWLRVIECLKKTGMSVRDIKVFIDWCVEGDATIDKRLALIERQKEKTLAQIASLNATLDTLRYKQWYYETAKKAGTCAVHDTIRDEEIPEEMLAIRRRLQEETG